MQDDREEIVTVAELTRRLSRAVQRVTGREWVEGELSSVKNSPVGHAYFSLKDEREEATLDCVMYRMEAARARRWLADGGRVQVLGAAMVYAPRGRLQLRVERLRPAGRGALLEALERLKARLDAEGLFDPGRKRPLPADPRVIGVVTSATGAAFQDVCKVAFGRGRVRIVLADARVQGEEAPPSIVRALALIQRHPDVDLVIVGRGGGSAEDLAAFNDESVVRAVAACRLPTVSGVGHEIDTSLTDLVADVRAATPSQAAELAVPDHAGRARTLVRGRQELVRVVRARLREERANLQSAAATLRDPRYLLLSQQQHLDDLTGRLRRGVERSLARRRSAVETARGRVEARHPRAVLGVARTRLDQLAARLVQAQRTVQRRTRADLSAHRARLDALSPVSILSRGYAIVTSSSGGAVRRAADVQVGEEVSVRLHEGAIVARVAAVRRGSA